MNKKRKSKGWIVIGLFASIIIVVSVFQLMRPAQTPYESVEARKGDIITYYSFSGNVEAKNRMTVIADKMAQISEIKIKEGSRVKENDILILTSAGDEVKSKIDGEVINLTAEENAQVMAGTKLMDIVDYDNLNIKIKVDEYDIAALKEGKEVEVKIGAVDQVFTGKINSVSKEGQVANGVTFFTATVDLIKNTQVKIGMSAEVRSISSEVKDVIILPMSAVEFDENNRPYILRKDEKGNITKQEITTGLNDGTNVEIKSGTLAGETIFFSKVKETRAIGFRRNINNNERGTRND